MVSRLFSSFTVDRVWGYGLVWLQQHDVVNPEVTFTGKRCWWVGLDVLNYFPKFVINTIQ